MGQLFCLEGVVGCGRTSRPLFGAFEFSTLRSLLLGWGGGDRDTKMCVD